MITVPISIWNIDTENQMSNYLKVSQFAMVTIITATMAGINNICVSQLFGIHAT